MCVEEERREPSPKGPRCELCARRFQEQLWKFYSSQQKLWNEMLRVCLDASWSVIASHFCNGRFARACAGVHLQSLATKAALQTPDGFCHKHVFVRQNDGQTVHDRRETQFFQPSSQSAPFDKFRNVCQKSPGHKSGRQRPESWLMFEGQHAQNNWTDTVSRVDADGQVQRGAWRVATLLATSRVLIFPACGAGEARTKWPKEAQTCNLGGPWPWAADRIPRVGPREREEATFPLPSALSTPSLVAATFRVQLADPAGQGEIRI